MIPLLLLARAFVRQNRWLLLAFALWPFVLGAFVWSPHGSTNQEDVTEIIQQEVFYGTAVIAFLASSGIYNERRSRRILAILSKAVSRFQLLMALLLGSLLFAIAYFAAVGVSLVCINGWSARAAAAAAAIFLRATIASLWIASLSLLFSTFLYPFVAASLAGIAAFAPIALLHGSSLLAPLTALIANINPFSSGSPWLFLLTAIGEASLFMVLGAKIFAGRDVTATVE